MLKWKLRWELKVKLIMGFDFFIYYIYYFWVYDILYFYIGFDWFDDVIVCYIVMYIGCWKYELVYVKFLNFDRFLKVVVEDIDVYIDVEKDEDDCVWWCLKECWVCGGVDECWDNFKFKVFCWEDIDFWIICDFESNGGCDWLVM